MTTVSSRLHALTGLTGATFAQHLHALTGLTGVTMATHLHAYSGLTGATMAQHLTVDRAGGLMDYVLFARRHCRR